MTINGTVKWFNPEKGYGFISTEEPEGDFFVHWKNISMEGFKKLEAGDKVSFEKEQTEKGWQAIDVKKAG